MEIKTDYFKSTKHIHFLFIAVISIFTAFRMYYATTINLVCDEAYYWMWSRNLSLGYYDSGALLAFVIRFFTDIFGNTELGVRMGGILFSLGTNILLYVLAIRFVKPMSALFAVLLFNITPGGVLIGMLMMHDSLMAFFWLLSVLFIHNAISKEKRWPWYVAGIFAGLGLWSKDTMILIVPITFLFLVFSKKNRYWLLCKEPYISFILMLLVFSPIIIWNSQHDWLTYRHIFALGSRGTWSKAPEMMLEFIGSQAGLISPFIWLAIITSWIVLTVHWIKLKSSEVLFLLCYSFPVFLFFLLLSMRSSVEGNWPGFGYLLGAVAVAAVFQTWWEKGKKRIIVLTMSIAVGFSVLLGYIILYPRILHIVVPHFPIFREEAIAALRTDRTQEVHGWKRLAQNVREFKEFLYPDPDVFVFTTRYQTAAELAFYYPNENIKCLPISRRMNQYDVWGGLDTIVGKDGILVIEKDTSALGQIRQYFDSVEWKKDIDVFRSDFITPPIRRYSVYICKNFKGIPEKDLPKLY